MKTLYLRNVPDEVSDRLATLASREGLSLSAFAVRELGEIAQRADNADLLRALPDRSVLPEDVVAGIAEGRARS